MKIHFYLFTCIIVFACQSPSDRKDTNQISIPAINDLEDLDVKLSKPKPGEWLYINDEKGQSFEEYVKSKPVTLNSAMNKIYLQPLGDFTEAQKSIIQFTADYLNIFFDLDVIVLPALDDNIISDSTSRFRDSDREQLLTTSILNYLQANIPKNGLVIMAITSKDLYPGSNYNFVFGLARTKKRVGVSSIYRYSCEPLDTTNYSVCLERLIKTSSHEISHMLSFQHCTHSVCVMNGSNSLPESDALPNRLCSECLKKLHWNLHFDVTSRLKKLQAYFLKHNLASDYKLTCEDLQVVEKE